MADSISVLEKEAEEIRARIEPKREEIREDEQQLERIEAALRVLRGQSPAGPAPRRAGQSLGRLTASQIDDAAVLAFVRDNQPATGAQIGAEIGASGNALSMKLRRMQDGGLLRAEGTGRAKRYSLVG